ALCDPLVRAGGALARLPFVREEVLEEVVAPLRRRLGPGDFEAARDRVTAHAGAEAALPSETLLLEHGRLGVGADELRVPGTVGLAERVATGDQRDRLLVVHRHAAEGLPDVLGCGDRVRLPVRTLRVDVDQAHLHGTEGILEVAVARIALVVEPRLL